ncbi:6-phosphogluconolactonase [Cellulomonas sp. DKR-3]|uniref:6-phosphogluconolactonase n=1 Tax=Cellulomonas fulva TaxID=2835530 RepID=A0ABS5TV06_9CELL|nr:6-phosphogluconolactonase [Cellulomonas fulva]MBT0992987.1 6-phosphogluconolactonase [Cellulomonas fulva]
MSTPPTVHADAQALGAAAAALVADRIEAAGPRPFLLGCPGGRSAASTYLALAEEVRRRGLDLSRLVVVMMDDYLVPDGDGGLRREDPAAAHSCERFARLEIVAPLNAAAARGQGVADENVWLPDPADPAAYDERIRAAGGIDLFLLASGASDGHVAFNPPGSDAATTTRVVQLPDTTRRDNLATFPTFGGDLAAVPTHGVTVGIATIRDHSREVLMLVHGADKRGAVRRLAGADRYDADWPATVFVDCAHPHLFVDEAAAADVVASTTH